MSGLKLYLLGPPRLERDGVPLEFDTRKNMALIAYLAVTGEGHNREALITLLWPELEPSRARAGLRRNLSVLKKALGGEWLVVERETIGTDPHADFWSDVDQFQDLLTSCRGHGHPQADFCPACLTSLAEAVELYRGDFLEGFSLRDSPNFDDWQFFQTESLRQELASALGRLVRGHTAQAMYQAAIPYARRWLALDPLHEAAHRHLMGLYAWSGQRAAALRQYGECERVLDEELGVPPEGETAQLFKAIKEQREIPGELSLDLSPPGDSLTTPLSQQPAGRKQNLPVQPTPFVGRKEELAELGRLLADPDVRLVTVLGAGGMGKTRLALQAAGAQLDSFTHGVFLVSLAPLQSVDSIVPTVAKTLDFSFYERSQPDQQLLDYLSRKNVLLIMDSYEHLLDGAGWVTEVLQETAYVRIVTTSRAKLNVQSEHLFTVLGMDFPDTTSKLTHDDRSEEPTEVDQYGAIQLFLQAARRVQPGFDLTTENRSHVVRICRLVEGMPLAILLAAAWLEMLTPAEIGAEIGKGLDFLESDLRDVPARQRSMRAVFDHSWHLLPERERKVFQALSVFRGGFTRQAAKQVIDGSLRDLRSLVNKSLVYRTPTGRYEMHEMLRQYAAEKLATSTAHSGRTRDRHAAYYTVILGRQAENLRGPQAQSALAQIELESENARAAWTWAVEHQRVELLEQPPVEALFLFYLWRRRDQEGEAACRLAAEHLEPMVSDDGLRVLSRILMWQGSFSWRLGCIEFANRQLQKSLALLERLEAENLDVRPEKASVLLQMGHITLDVDLERANRLSEQSLSLFRELDDSWGAANALSALGWAAMGGGDYPEARQLFEESLAIRQSMGDQRGFIDSLGGCASQPSSTASLRKPKPI
jgi:predicted ATPase/DNA-binding SARP family transcriptional activator